MNFSLYGNDARFIRRSCSPTAEVRACVKSHRVKKRLEILSIGLTIFNIVDNNEPCGQHNTTHVYCMQDVLGCAALTLLVALTNSNYYKL